MKLKVVVVDLEISPCAKKWCLRIGIPLVALFGGGTIAYAAGLVTWTSGETLQAADLNNNFTYLQGEITALQAQPVAASAEVQGCSGTTATITQQAPTGWISGTCESAGVFYLTFAAGQFPANGASCVVTPDQETPNGALNAAVVWEDGLGGANGPSNGLYVYQQQGTTGVNDYFHVVCVGK